jgi:hypothetical protein
VLNGSFKIAKLMLMSDLEMPGDLLRDSPGLSICGKSDYSVKGAFSMKSTELGAE